MFIQKLSEEPEPDITELLAGLRQGSAAAWNAFAAKYRNRLRDVAASALPAQITRRADASDIVQQTQMEASQTIDAFRGSTMPELYAWLVGILNHNVADAIQQHIGAQKRTVYLECSLDDTNNLGIKAGGVCAADQTSPSMAAAREEAHERLQLAVESLPPRQRDAVRMRHLERRPLSEIAMRLGCNSPAAAAVIARGLRGLREKLQQLE